MGKISKIIGLIFSGFFSIGFVLLAIITMLPAEASKPNLLGYYGVCSFAPKSTAILILISAVSMIVALRLSSQTKEKRFIQLKKASISM
jgi:hypothetical protein